MKTEGVSIRDCGDKLITLIFLFLIGILFLSSVASGDMPPGPPDLNINGKISYSDDVPAVNADITITSKVTKKSCSVVSGDDGNWVFLLSTTEYPNGKEALITAIDSVGNTANTTIIVNVSVEAQPQIVNMKFEVPAPSPPPTQTPIDDGDGDGSDGYVPATLTPTATPGVTPISSPTAALTQTTEPTPTPIPTITATETPTEPTPASSTPTTMPKRGIWFRFSKPGFDTPFFIVIAIAAILAAAILLVAVYLRRKREGGE